MSSPAPIKRSPQLAPLSRDHHQGLMLCWKVRRGLALGISQERIIAYVRYVFLNDLEEHFRQEEEILFPLLLASHPLRQQAENEHKDLREKVAGLDSADDTPVTLHAFADALDSHIRFEERVLFQTIEQSADPVELERAGALIADAPHSCELTWEDAFWITPKA